MYGNVDLKMAVNTRSSTDQRVSTNRIMMIRPILLLDQLRTNICRLDGLRIQRAAVSPSSMPYPLCLGNCNLTVVVRNVAWK